MSGPLRSFILLSLFTFVKSLDLSKVAGYVTINKAPGVYSLEAAVSKLQYTDASGSEQIVLRPEIINRTYENNPCGAGGECVYLDENLPTHRVVCYCYSGFRGRFCDENFRTKLMISIFFWVVFIFEVILIWVALRRSGDESSYPSAPTSRALVFVLQERRLD